MNARDMVNEGAGRLAAAGVAEAGIKMEWWASEALGIGRDGLDATFPDDAQRQAVEQGVIRLERHEPLQYVIGHTPFLDCRLITDPRALIPRPETEELAMRVLGCRPLWSRRNVRIADVGTGSGCLAIALAVRHAEANVIATDISEAALELARENARRNGVGDRIEFLHGDLLAGLPVACLDAVVSNPPYIARGVLAGLEPTVRDFEPVSALDGGSDGLEIIRRLVVQAFTALKDGGRLWLEIGDEQGSDVDGLMKEAGFQDVHIVRDMYGKNRFAEGIACFQS